jgi:hypothetical protein
MTPDTEGRTKLRPREPKTPMLAQQRSARWAFMEKFVIPSFDDDAVYLTRWRIVQTPWAAVYLHRLTAPDSRPTLHDHPWKFLALVLRGGYVERRLNPTTMTVNESHRIRRVNRMRTCDAHAIVTLTRNPTWTLLLVGPRQRTWGYWEPDLLPDNPQWTWTPFDRHAHAAEFDAALSRRKAKATP